MSDDSTYVVCQVAEQSLSLYSLQVLKNLEKMVVETSLPWGGAAISASTLANCRLSLNTAWLFMHVPYLRHLREIADGVHHPSVMD